MTNDLNSILADCDAAEILQTLNRFDIQLRTHVPDAILLTESGELNTRNKYGSILFHVRMLTSVLHNFDVGGIS